MEMPSPKEKTMEPTPEILGSRKKGFVVRPGFSA